MNLMSDITDFHKKFGLEYDGPPRLLPADLQHFRTKFMEEENDEFLGAQTAEDQLDALVDLAYVVYGTMYLHGGEPGNFSTLLQAGECSVWVPIPYDNQERVTLYSMMKREIGNYSALSSIDPSHSLMALMNILVAVNQVSRSRQFPFSKAWTLVHSANITKTRAKRPEDSTRGSGWDVIKPKGWTPPDYSLIMGTST